MGLELANYGELNPRTTDGTIIRLRGHAYCPLASAEDMQEL